MEPTTIFDEEKWEEVKSSQPPLKLDKQTATYNHWVLLTKHMSCSCLCKRKENRINNKQIKVRFLAPEAKQGNGIAEK